MPAFHLSDTPQPPPTLMTPKAKLTNNPVTTATCLRLLHTPSSRNSHMPAPTGQKNPIRFPQSISSIAPLPSSSSFAPAATPSNPSPLLLLPPPPPLAEGADVLSSHRSSRRRIAAGLGIVSGVWVCAVRARNWERREAISVEEKPAVRRRSKPSGGLSDCGGWGACWAVEVDEEENEEEC